MYTPRALGKMRGYHVLLTLMVYRMEGDLLTSPDLKATQTLSVYWKRVDVRSKNTCQ